MGREGRAKKKADAAARDDSKRVSKRSGRRDPFADFNAQLEARW
jgi:hypothetical protein